MRLLERNKRALWYADPTGESTPSKDEWGNETGEFTPIYSDPVQTKLNYSAASGEAVAEAFGAFTDYSMAIAAPLDCAMTESSLLWIGVEPPQPANYKIVRVAKSLTSILLAVKEVAL